MLTTGIGWSVGNPFPAVALPIPDNSLGTFITPNVLIQGQPADRIDGGFRPGSGTVLFHSFERFDIDEVERVYFGNPLGVTNIFSRVTSSDPSEIFGTLGVDGPANLFLMNPNGILFGPNARLDVSGSFVATTADGMEFDSGEVFSSDRTAPLPSPLAINPSALLFSRITPAPITNQSIAPNLTTPDLIDGLTVPEGQALLFAGGDITLEGGFMRAPGGRIQLTSMGAPGRVEVGVARSDSPILGFAAAEGTTFADVVLTDGAVLDVTSGDRGDIVINADNIDISGISNLCAGLGAQDFCGNIETDDPIGSATSQAGNISLLATGEVRIREESRVGNNVRQTATGNFGNIIEIIADDPTDAFGSVEIVADSLVMESGAVITTTTFGTGSAGAILISARAVDLNGSSLFSQVFEGATGDAGGIILIAEDVRIANASTVRSAVLENAVGNAGGIAIQADSLILNNNSDLNTSTAGQGRAGVMILEAQDITLNNTSSIVSETLIGGVGAAGNVEIRANTFSMLNGSILSTSTAGIGEAGSLSIDAQQVTLDGESSIESQIFLEGTGDAGDISILADRFEMFNGSRLTTKSSGQGNAGIIIIQSQDIALDNAFIISNIAEGARGNAGGIGIQTITLTASGTEILTSSSGRGQPGAIIIRATGPIVLSDSLVFSNVEAGGRGGFGRGSVEITAQSLQLLDGAQLQTIVRGREGDLPPGRGDAGNITVFVEETLLMAGHSPDGFPSLIASSVDPGTQSNSGLIQIAADSLVMSNDAGFEFPVGITTSTAGQGDAGVVIIGAREIQLDGGAVISSASDQGSRGDAGAISIVVLERLLLSEGSAISTLVDGRQGLDRLAGLILLQAPQLILAEGSALTAITTSGLGGGIAIDQTEFLLLVDGSNISSSAGFEGTPGDGGNIAINSSYVIGTPALDNNITAEAFTGTGGRIFIDSRRLFSIANRPDVPTTNDISTDSEFGIDGQVTVNELDVDPSRGIVDLPTTIVDATNSVNQGCRVADANELGEFFITGRGGLPPSPSDLLDGDRVLTEWVTAESDTPVAESQSIEAATQPSTPDIQLSSPPPTSHITEAQGWMIGSDGDVVLTAEAVTATPVPPAVRPATCDDL